MRRNNFILRACGVSVLVGTITGCPAQVPALDVQQQDTGAFTDAGSDTMLTDVGGDGGICSTTGDMDRDGIPNNVECLLGTNPNVADSDGDGVSDGVERNYPHICIGVNAPQRRPPAVCTDTTDCQPGERCGGLDPLAMDSDGDGVSDGLEDADRNGNIQFDLGETDPRLVDTDGDGVNDAMSGVAICRADSLAMITQVPINPGTTQVGHDPAWGTSVEVAGTNFRGARLLDDPSVNVSAIVATVPGGTDVRATAASAAQTISAALGSGVTPVLVGRAFTAPDNSDGITSVYRVQRSATSSASELRDLLVAPLVGTAPPASTLNGAGTEFLLEISTVYRPGANGEIPRADLVIALAPRVSAEDVMVNTSIRVNDLVNASAIAARDARLGSACDTFRTAAAPQVDFLWTVDTSGSMDVQQAKLGRVATQFFDGLRATGVDFRIGVIEAGSASLNLDSPGFNWIRGSDPMGARTMCERVTVGTCPTSTIESSRPYAFPGRFGDGEEPAAAAMLSHWAFLRRGLMGEMNVERRFRPDAKVVAFFVTDEPTSATFSDANDWVNYYQTGTDPQSLTTFGPTYTALSVRKMVAYFQRNRVLTFGMVPVYTERACTDDDPRDLPRCVIEGNGGATIPIGTATDSEVSAAISRVAIAIAGSSSQFRLTRTPITSTIKIRVGTRDVPRSRSEGFDYDNASKSIIFYGTRFRPGFGESVVVSYRTWAGGVG